MKCCIPAMPCRGAARKPPLRCAECGRGKPGLVEAGANFLLRKLRIGQRTGIPKIEIEDNVILGRHFAEARVQRLRRFRQPTDSQHARRRRGLAFPPVDTPPRRSVSICRQGTKVFQRALAIIPRSQYFQHQSTQTGICGRKPAGEEAGQWLRTFDQRGYSLATVRGLWIGGKIGEMIFHLGIDLFTRLSRTAPGRSSDSVVRGQGR